MISAIKQKRLRKVAKLASETLISRFGKKPFYSAKEVAAICDELKLGKADVMSVYVMFAEEQSCEAFLSEVGVAEESRSFRVLLAKQLFRKDYVVSYESLFNKFHDFDDKLAISSLGSRFSSGLGRNGLFYDSAADTGSYGGDCGGCDGGGD